MTRWLSLLFLAALPAAGIAEKSSDKGDGALPARTNEAGAVRMPDAAARPVITEHAITVGGRALPYRSESGMLPLFKEDGTVRASLFYVAYTRRDATNLAERPVLFCFNGGPGASAVWLHIGGLGPRRAFTHEDASLPPPPYRMVDNEHTILTAADLVFIDPVSTGFSRAAKDEKAEQFFGKDPDIEAVADFIRLYCTRNGRWGSPKYLCGESYGVFRAAGVAQALQSRHHMFLNGLVLVSGLLDFGTILPGPANDLPYALFLPTFTATAHFHGKLPPDLQADRAKALAETRRFMSTDYAGLLMRGAAITADERNAAAAEIARLTGLSRELVLLHDLRVPPAVFQKRLLEDRGLVVGRFDSRLTGRDRDPSAQTPTFDVSFTAAAGPLVSAMNVYLRDELKFETDLPYRAIGPVGPWSFPQNQYASTSEDLADVLTENPHLRVLVLTGLRDLACPPESVRYTVDHLRVHPDLRRNISFAEYESGHMMYLHLPDLKKLQKDLEAFLR
jgi:carboxypeptidase C (cathepsin A)